MGEATYPSFGYSAFAWGEACKKLCGWVCAHVRAQPRVLVEGAEADVRDGAPWREDDITSHRDRLLCLTAAPSKGTEKGRKKNRTETSKRKVPL